MKQELANSDSYELNSNYGTAQDLSALSKALHDRGMYLMVDVVANHMVFLFPATSSSESHETRATMELEIPSITASSMLLTPPPISTRTV